MQKSFNNYVYVLGIACVYLQKGKQVQSFSGAKILRATLAFVFTFLFPNQNWPEYLYDIEMRHALQLILLYLFMSVTYTKFSTRQFGRGHKLAVGYKPLCLRLTPPLLPGRLESKRKGVETQAPCQVYDNRQNTER